jgi:hypothetical protein
MELINCPVPLIILHIESMLLLAFSKPSFLVFQEVESKCFLLRKKLLILNFSFLGNG